jgi:serine/threonine protein kinase/formylglycine-generating enzyme required for sulfatase activity
MNTNPESSKNGTSVEQARDDFALAWRQGQRPRIERFLGGTTQSLRSALLRTILTTELALRAADGERPVPEEYLDRFPEDVDTIRAVFALGDTEPPPAEALTEASAAGAAAPTSLFCPPTEARLAGLTPGGSSASPGVPEHDVPMPGQIGRYHSIRFIGQGGYGRVYSAFDEELGRTVALKLPRDRLLDAPDRIQGFLAEARLAARLKHPSIVTIHDVGRLEGIGPYFVMEYIPGESLQTLLEKARLAPARLAEILAQVADAVHHAHGAGLVHRDLKPANILIDAQGVPHVTDFGMAVTEDLQRLRSGEIAGTLLFMAPEQVRGETHRLDGRTDIWALGVILYLGLTGRHPFSGQHRREIFDEIEHRDPRPPRQVDGTVPRELERICLKCLARRMTERYQTAADLAEDLRSWISTSPGTRATASASASGTVTPAAPAGPRTDSGLLGLGSERQSIPIVPKGLRSFDREDADFFLALLPGPRDREGLPEPIRFWKTRIEETESDRTFSVGVLYGPSGCGKTSLIKAGLLPRLPPGVRSIYLEASATGTEARLLAALRRACPGLPASWSLTEVIAALREGQLAPAPAPAGDKLLIVLDQFEQWLHAHPDDSRHELVGALRQCDGGRVQGLLLVRDDFWMSISRFMRALEVRMVEGRNSAAVELFDPVHARKVLVAFGRAWDRFPHDPAAPGPGPGLTTEQARFLDRAIADLGRPDDGRIIPVRLSLFAEMVRGRTWNTATLDDVGGAEGLGVRFLEETFCGSSAPPEHRVHELAARVVLKALLPESSTTLKGARRSSASLLEVSGYARRPEEFAALIRILDAELRLITLTEPDDHQADSASALATETAPAPDIPRDACYLLAHDALVPSLRQWLTQKQRATRRGRAELRLSERSDFWNARPESRHLASIGEWAGILLWTRKRDWTAPQKRMMRAATRRYTAGLTVAAALLAAAVSGTVAHWRRSSDQQKAIRASGLVEELRVARISAVPAIIQAMDGYRPWLDRSLEALAGDSRQPPEVRQRALLALRPIDARRAAAILDQGTLFACGPEELSVVRSMLPARPDLIARLWDVAAVAAKAGDGTRLLHAAGVLAGHDPEGAGWRQIATPVADQLVCENVLRVGAWSDVLRPVLRQLAPGLGAVFRDPHRPPTERTIATEVLGKYTEDDPPARIELVKDADPAQFALLLPGLAPYREVTVEQMNRELARTLPPDSPEEARERLAHRQANAAIVLLRLGSPDPVWPALKQSLDPRVRSELICTLSQRGVEPLPLVGRLGVEADPSIRLALLLTLAGYPSGQLEPEPRAALLDQVARIYQEDPDSGIHSAARCLLLRWGRAAQVRALDEILKGEGPRDSRRWYVTAEGQTMVVVSAGAEPESTARRPWARVPHPFAISAHEVTVAEMLRFKADYQYHSGFSPTPECPANLVTWYLAAAYCRWLSEREGVPEDQMCYPPIAEIKDGMVVADDFMDRTGYRLATQAEWEKACRAGTRTPRFFGVTDALLPWYAWYVDNARGRLHPTGVLLPNDLGLFDMLGNALEWCQDGSSSGGDGNGDERLVTIDRRRVLKGGSVNYRAQQIETDPRDLALPTILFNSVGFRIARTYRPTP